MVTIKRLSEVRNDKGELTHQMCCICFVMMPVADCYVDAEGQKWDLCPPCAHVEAYFDTEQEKTIRGE